jgi:RNA polymerase sigma-70 factor (ECF subfamily)
VLKVYPILKKLEDDEDLVHDLVETFMRRREVPSFAKPYLRQCINNLRIDNWRKNKIDVGSQQAFDWVKFDEVVMEDDGSKERFDELARKAAALPTKQLEVLELRMQGLSYKEIARKTGIPIGTVRSRIYHARGKTNGHSKPKRRQSKAS